LQRPDDSTLTHEALLTVEREADRLLLEAAAYGRFPTPTEDLLAAAKLVVVDDQVLDEALLARFLKKARATMATLKSALSKVLGLFEPHERLVVIDRDTPAPRIPFVKLHEAGHGVLPHQSKMYRLMQDCEQHLDPDTADLFEREANVFASEALFQGTSFASEAHDSAISVKVPIRLARKYGSSNYAAFRRYITTNPRTCCLVVLDSKSLKLDTEGNFTIQLRRVVAAKSFSARYDCEVIFRDIDHKHALGPIVPIGRKMTRAREVRLLDRNGDERICTAEAFDTTHQVFIVVSDVKSSGKGGRIVVPPAWG